MKTIQQIFFIVLLLLNINAYSQDDFTKDFNERLLKSIYPPSPSQIKFTKSFCEILGILNEYGGRYIRSFVAPPDDLIDVFSSTKKENELAFYFKNLIEEYETEIGTSLNLRVQAQNGFYSKTLCSLINCLYIPDYNPLDLYTLNKKYILKLPDDLKIAYLKGVYHRFGSGSEISISNGINKLRTVASIMESLGITNIKIYSSGPNTLPTVFILTFELSSNLKDQINYIDSESDLESYPEKVLIKYKTDK